MLSGLNRQEDNGSVILEYVACVASVSSRGSSRKLGEQKKMNDLFFFCFRSNFRAITRLETLATQAIEYAKSLIFNSPGAELFKAGLR